MRRLVDAAYTAGHLIRAMPPEEAIEHTIRVLDARNAGENKQVTVIDINDLPDRRSGSSSASSCGSWSSRRRDGARPLVFLVLDELNKYAPREGWSPIKEVILDIAERGRSLGVVLIGAQQTASEIERRVTANASFRVAGRLDTAEATRGEYGFLTRRREGARIDPEAGHDVPAPAGDPGAAARPVPVPGVGDAQATRSTSARRARRGCAEGMP